MQEAVASRVAGATQKASTVKIYQSKWRKFTQWCAQKDVQPLRASEQEVADFLLHLLNDCHMQISNGTDLEVSVRGRHY